MVNKESSIYIADSIYESGAGGGVPAGYVDIGGKVYPTTEINGVVWLAENLDYRYRNLIINDGVVSNNIPKACYYNKDELTYGSNGKHFGLLYNYSAIEYLEQNKSTLIPGWHVPTKAEFETMISYLGGNIAALSKLKSNTDWDGNNSSGFNGVPSGEWWDTNYFLGGNDECAVASITKKSSSLFYVMVLGNQTDVQIQDLNIVMGCCIRLVKDP